MSVAGRAYLELLVREASPVEFEGPLLDARSRGAGPAEIAELEATRTLALQVRATLERRLRRQTELAALFQTASDLAACRDVDAVLTAIVDRTRQLLGADVGYLTFNDPDRGDTYMRITNGSVSAAFRQLRLPMGAGLGGLAAQTALPYVTADYFGDDRFRHTPTIDAAVAEEGLVAILGVPLLLGTRVLGVLYAANRHPRTFSPEELSLVGSLAAHAAVALDTARLLEDTGTAVAQLRETSWLLRLRSESVDRAAALHDRLTGVVLRGGGPADVAAVVAGVLGGTLRLTDADGRELARICGDDSGPDDTAPDGTGLADAVARSRATGRAEREQDAWVLAVVAGTEHLGALVLVGRPDLGDADLRSFERAGLVTALLLLFRRSLAEAENRVRGDLIDDLLARPAPRDPEGLRARARRIGVDLDAPHVVVAARASRDGERHLLAPAAAHLAARAGGLAGEHDGDVVLVLPGVSTDAVAEAVRRARGTASARATVGLAGPATGPPAVRAAAAEARRCVDGLLAVGRPGQLATTADLGFVGLLLGSAGDVSAYVEGTIGPLLRYDRQRGTALCLTLEHFYAGGCSLGRAAESLHLHVNTVTQRLARIDQLLGDSWRRPDRGLEIQLALRLHRLVRRTA